MASFVLTTTARNNIAGQLNDDLDGGKLKLLTSGDSLLVTFTLPAKGGNDITDGVLTFDTIADAQAGAGGVAAKCSFHKADDTKLADGDVGLPASGATVELINTNIAENQTVQIDSATITVPAGT